MSSEDRSPETALSLAEYSGFAALMFGSSGLSAFGSICIIKLCARRANRSHLHHRILLALSISDVGLSISNVLQLFLSPELFWVGNRLAMGNWDTCKIISSIWSLFAFSGPIYNCMLALFFYLTICRNLSEKTLVVWLERPMHLFVLISCTAIPIAAIPFDAVVFHSLTLVCIPSGRKAFFQYAPGVIVGVSTMTSFAATITTGCQARTQMRKSLRHSFNLSLGNDMRKTSREAGTQSVLYCLAFLNSILWIVVTTVIGLTAPIKDQLNGYYPLKLAGAFFYPLQGFFNFCIYLRPVYTRWKRAEPDKSWWWAFWKAATSHDKPPRLPRRRSRSNLLLAVQEKEDEGIGKSTHSSEEIEQEMMAQELERGECGIAKDDKEILSNTNGATSRNSTVTFKSEDTVLEDSTTAGDQGDGINMSESKQATEEATEGDGSASFQQQQEDEP